MSLLRVENVYKKFGGLTANQDISFNVQVGEIVGLIGPNGAGKTTMMDVITGKTGPRNADVSGRVFLGQTIDLMRMTEPQIAQAGIGRKFQRPTVFEQHTVFENLELAMKMDKRVKTTLFARLSSEQIGKIEEILKLIRLNGQEHRIAGLLSHGQKQWLEIGMLLMQEPQLLLLDEPVAGMSDAETARTAELLNELRGKHSIMVVEHDMGFVEEIAQGGKVTVLHEGSVLAEGNMRQVQSNERVIEVYLGR
ncbi:urea ABC transporter ATP-binding protein UrtD [Klebsiella pneumoniae]|uniref:urea ABC transporter ATP-binding protein UrtD n=1 Tax=Klebsiella pneumoniae TaxID=573 RepID=UPI001BD0DC08|nr:urea ABC transporter ATP-binding protein UrtD [Klebsiella pneumoniae]MBS4669959.1 urea ABC transporter ATP-binding protein UrtD [Klebsiella pneumoniae]